MIIRKADPSDWRTVADFNFRLALESEGLPLESERLQSGVRAMLSDPGKGRYLLAEEDGKAVGQLAFTFEWSDWRNATFWWLQSVYVIPEARRKGVLSALFERALQLAAEEGVCGVRLYVEHENHRAKAAYRTLGLAPTSYEMYEADFVIDRARIGGPPEPA